MDQKETKSLNIVADNSKKYDKTCKDFPKAAQRALAEAAARKQKETKKQMIKELGGRKAGKEPTRFGDWEFKGRAIDF